MTTPTRTSVKRDIHGGSLRLLLVVLPAFVIPVVTAQNSNDRGYLDRFTYQDEDIARPDQFIDYAPQNWNDISCNEGSKLDECLGYRDKWETGRDWSITKNYCRWCPDKRCGRHHQSPIDLKREVGFEPGTHESANECIDVHWMKYEDSFCTWDQLIDADAFTIERHALRISQPITVYDNFNDDTDGVRDGVTLNCRIPGKGSRFGRIDYSKGFSQWWHLSHIDIHTPSEHTQDGKRYDAEIQLQHFYSVTASQAGVNNEMGTVSVFMQAYEDAAPYRYLDKIICQWRRKEYEVRKECGLDPIETSYPGCFPLKRNLRRKVQEVNATSTNAPKGRSKFQTAQDVILHNYQFKDHPNHSNVKIFMEESNWAPAEEKDWDAWIAEQSQKMQQEEELYHRMRTMDHGGNHTDQLHQQFRQLLEYDEIEWFNYWPMLGVRTEYYFRYSGSQTIPPCYGNFVSDTREGTNHWRVMKDPIRIHPRQLQELQRLIADRISPKGSLVSECQPDTAAKVQRDGNKVIEVQAARPLMSWHNVHFKTFCECKDWDSKWPEDREWCKIDNINERFYDKPYNFGW
mmetsp:Transcript_3495/g.6582  ORF Transcript_3495/g.6582 Transcript_3495/m.6582 type:complete len:572 (+) Transcript_3495:230-1945(+)